MAAGVHLVISRLPANKRDAVAGEIEADIRRFLDDVMLELRERGIAIAPSTIGALFDQRFTEDELRHLVALPASAVHAKYLALTGDLDCLISLRLVIDLGARQLKRAIRWIRTHDPLVRSPGEPLNNPVILTHPRWMDIF